MYVVVELQKTSDDAIASLVTTHNTLEEAQSKFHQVLSYAAVSTLPLHSCVLLNEDAYSIKTESYAHEVEQNE